MLQDSDKEATYANQKAPGNTYYDFGGISRTIFQDSDEDAVYTIGSGAAGLLIKQSYDKGKKLEPPYI